MSPVTEKWVEVLRTHLALGEEGSPVRAAAVFSADAGFFAVAGRGDEDGWPYFRSTAPDAEALDDVEALCTVCAEAVHPRGLRIAGALWQRESREVISDVVTGNELELALVRDGDRVMWVVRAAQGVRTFVLVDGDSEAKVSQARSLALDFDSFLAGQGY
ncbi:hypothetical protein ACFUCT_28370 [Streptomyces parvus]|uniref:hypothetical protein n=1 Tax=Streptomyces TaxID=1883 RepID=UPI00081BAEC6|nr:MULTISPECIES: hypothetical protein [unclassified Streptomyces]PJN35045.1 hypothetical protein CG717_02030 [Streptomyces sp. CB02613]SCE20733.1 hypothetical protein GA0115253_103554 [Streptomyces sp. Termitarium-T10T-6]